MAKIKTLLIIAAAVFGMAISTQAQNLDNLVLKSFEHMKKQEWGEAQVLLEKAAGIVQNRKNHQVAIIHYNKGFCELRLSKVANAEKNQHYAELANTSFTTCQRFPSNIFYAKSFYYQALANMQSGQYESALNAFNQFLKNRNPARDSYDKGLLNLYKATCHFKLVAQQAE